MISYDPARVFMAVALPALSGCGNPAERGVRKLYKASLDQDVTASAAYNFAPFVGTVWKNQG